MPGSRAEKVRIQEKYNRCKNFESLLVHGMGQPALAREPWISDPQRQPRLNPTGRRHRQGTGMILHASAGFGVNTTDPYLHERVHKYYTSTQVHKYSTHT
jgi:hypothetical protein